MKLFFLLTCLCLIMIGNAQKNISFSSQNYIGLLEGEHGSKLQLQTINGARYKSWFAGLGVGLDWYYQRSVPLFISLNKDFFKKGKRSFFASADGGMNFPWGEDNNLVQFGYETDKLLNGLYWGLGLGYKIGLGAQSDGILLQVCYNYKYSGKDTKVNYYNIDPLSEPYQNGINRYEYHLQRLSLKLGFQF